MLAIWKLSSVKMRTLVVKSQDEYSDAVTLSRTPPAKSHGSEHQSCCLLLAHPLNGGHVASSSCGKYQRVRCIYVCVCACVVHVGKVVCYMLKDAVQSGLRHHTQLTEGIFTLQDQLVTGK